MSKFGTKSVLFGYFWPRILKTYCLFEIRISTFKFVYLQNFAKKTTMSKFGIKSALFVYFWARILKNVSHVWNQHPQICLIFSKFCEKTKIP